MQLYRILELKTAQERKSHSGHFHIFYPFPRVQANAVNLTFPAQKRQIPVPILPLEKSKWV